MKKQNRPIILINMDYQEGSPDMIQISANYVLSLHKAGAIVLGVPVTTRKQDLAEVFRIADGVVFIGGRDYDPELWGDKRHRTTMLISKQRQKFDLLFADYAIEHTYPVLGICGGHQLLNIVLGGTLYTSLEDMGDKVLRHWPEDISSPVYHDVAIDRTSPIFSGYDTDSLRVNSFHHQAINKIGNGIRVTATAPDGIIEGFEGIDSPVFGIQWHPEKEFGDPVQMKIFEQFIKICIERT